MDGILRRIFDFLSIELTVILTAALPVIELRGAIPAGISLGLSPIHAAAISFLGSMIPSPLILFAIRPIFELLRKTKLFRKTVNRMIKNSYRKSGRIEKYGFWGLLLFVAIPLPGTGVWSGTLAASLLNMRFKQAFPAIFIGNLIACTIIMGFSHGLVNVMGYI